MSASSGAAARRSTCPACPFSAASSAHRRVISSSAGSSRIRWVMRPTIPAENAAGFNFERPGLQLPVR